VVARFHRDGAFAIDAIVDRQHLPPGFGTAARIDPRWKPVRNLTPELEARLGGLIGAAIDGVRIAFDGREVPARVELVPPEGGGSVIDAPELTLRFTGPIPLGARAFTWSNAVSLGSYMLTIRTEGEE